MLTLTVTYKRGHSVSTYFCIARVFRVIQIASYLESCLLISISYFTSVFSQFFWSLCSYDYYSGY